MEGNQHKHAAGSRAAASCNGPASAKHRSADRALAALAQTGPSRQRVLGLCRLVGSRPVVLSVCSERDTGFWILATVCFHLARGSY